MLEWFWLTVCHLSCNSICLHYRRHFLGWADILSCKHDIIDYRDVILLVMQGLYLVYLVSSQGHFRRRQWHPTPLLLPGKSHGWRSLVDCSPWGHEESDMTEWLINNIVILLELIKMVTDSLLLLPLRDATCFPFSWIGAWPWDMFWLIKCSRRDTK